jgi:NAD(P)-dependent dehydrogenase (short-subunit alcohol dehydrogenase family)
MTSAAMPTGAGLTSRSFPASQREGLRIDLSGTTAVVTGASSGLGRHFVHVLGAAGARVIAAARRWELLVEVAAEVPGTTPVVCDVTRSEDVAALVEVAAPGAGYTILVNNAGGAAFSPALDLSVTSFADSLTLNLTATFAMSTAFARPMIAGGGGSIVNIASMYGLVAAAPIPHAAYTAAKAGVVGLTRQLGCEWVRHGVRVNAIAPGWFDSDLTSEFLASERGAEYVRRNAPIGRPGRLDELDGLLLLLASRHSSYITGQTIAVDGGWTAR